MKRLASVILATGVLALSPVNVFGNENNKINFSDLPDVSEEQFIDERYLDGFCFRAYSSNNGERPNIVFSYNLLYFISTPEGPKATCFPVPIGVWLDQDGDGTSREEEYYHIDYTGVTPSRGKNFFAPKFKI